MEFESVPVPVRSWPGTAHAQVNSHKNLSEWSVSEKYSFTPAEILLMAGISVPDGSTFKLEADHFGSIVYLEIIRKGGNDG